MLVAECIIFAALLWIAYAIVRVFLQALQSDPPPRRGRPGVNAAGDADTYIYGDSGFSLAGSDASPHDHGCADPGGGYDAGACVDVGGHSGD